VEVEAMCCLFGDDEPRYDRVDSGFGPSSRARHCVIIRAAFDAQVLTPLRRPRMPVEAPMLMKARL
jgi:hypothetical protein